MGREEWLLSEAIERELELAYVALTKVDDEERSGQIPDPDDEWHDIERHALAWHLEKALRSIGVLAERLGAHSIEREVTKLRGDRIRLGDTSRPLDGDIHSDMYQLANACFAPLRAMTDTHALTAQGVLRNLLNNTAQIVEHTAVDASNEADVRNAVLSVLQLSFPDAKKEVTIPQLLTNSRGDLGVPSLRTMIEFKFVSSKAEMAAALKGVYSDMKTYTHPDWDVFYGVFYMTGPFYNDDDVRREFSAVRADISWTPILARGFGGRKSKEEKAAAKGASKSSKKKANG
jgi:hypothetical protein